MKRLGFWLGLGLVPLLIGPLKAADPAGDLKPWFALIQGDGEQVAEALKTLEREWDDDSATRAVELLRFLRPSPLRRELLRLLKVKTGNQNADDWGEWLRWLWQRPEADSESNLTFKAAVHERIDPRFRRYFEPGNDHEIRYDEILWGGGASEWDTPIDRSENDTRLRGWVS